jgi:hypothetical protein
MVGPSFVVQSRDAAGVPARQLLALALDGLPQITLVRLWIQQRQTHSLRRPRQVAALAAVGHDTPCPAQPGGDARAVRPDEGTSAMLRLTLRGAGRPLLVTDAMPLPGKPVEGAAR